MNTRDSEQWRLLQLVPEIGVLWPPPLAVTTPGSADPAAPGSGELSRLLGFLDRPSRERTDQAAQTVQALAGMNRAMRLGALDDMGREDLEPVVERALMSGNREVANAVWLRWRQLADPEGPPLQADVIEHLDAVAAELRRQVETWQAERVEQAAARLRDSRPPDPSQQHRDPQVARPTPPLAAEQPASDGLASEEPAAAADNAAAIDNATAIDTDGRRVEAAAGEGPPMPVALPEVDRAAPRFAPLSQDDLAPSGAVTRVRANLAALRTVRTLQAEGRRAGPAEQAVLARWSGWGAVPEALDERREDFAWARAELGQLLSPAELRAAARNTLNAHYTDLSLVAPIWEAVARLGFTEGPVLEPGCGSGNFIAAAPPGAEMVGVELEPMTAAVAAYLYPDAQILAESFAATRAPRGSFHLVVGNVPVRQGGAAGQGLQPRRPHDPQPLHPQVAAADRPRRAGRGPDLPLHPRRRQPRRAARDGPARRPGRRGATARERPPARRRHPGRHRPAGVPPPRGRLRAGRQHRDLGTDPSRRDRRSRDPGQRLVRRPPRTGVRAARRRPRAVPGRRPHRPRRPARRRSPAGGPGRGGHPRGGRGPDPRTLRRARSTRGAGRPVRQPRPGLPRRRCHRRVHPARRRGRAALQPARHPGRRTARPAGAARHRRLAPRSRGRVAGQHTGDRPAAPPAQHPLRRLQPPVRAAQPVHHAQHRQARSGDQRGPDGAHPAPAGRVPRRPARAAGLRPRALRPQHADRAQGRHLHRARRRPPHAAARRGLPRRRPGDLRGPARPRRPRRHRRSARRRPGRRPHRPGRSRVRRPDAHREPRRRALVPAADRGGVPVGQRAGQAAAGPAGRRARPAVRPQRRGAHRGHPRRHPARRHRRPARCRVDRRALRAAVPPRDPRRRHPARRTPLRRHVDDQGP